LAPACLQVSGVTVACERLGPLFAVWYSSAQCFSNAGGGCDCSAVIAQQGGLGAVTPDPQTSGDFTMGKGALTLDQSAEYGYCVSGETLVLNPEGGPPTVTGQIVLRRTGGG